MCDAIERVILMRFNVNAEYAQGKNWVEPMPRLGRIMASHVDTVIHKWPMSQHNLDMIKSTTQEDDKLQRASV